MTDPNDNVCVLPWIHLSTTVDGVWGRCCFDATNDYGHYYQQAEEPAFTLRPDAIGCLPGSRYARDNPEKIFGLSEAFNSPELRRTRLEMLAGERPAACLHCYQREDDGLRSHRTAMNTQFEPDVDLDDLMAGTAPDGSLDAEPFFLDLRFGNTCNLGCIMCSFPITSNLVRTAPSWTTANIDPFRDDEEFWQQLEAAAHRIRYIYFAGGEPFMQKGHDRAIDLLIRTGAARHIQLHYNSNLTIRPRAGFTRLREFAKVTIAASCDGVGEVFEKIRVGGRWEVFVRNLREARGEVDVWLDVSVQRHNVGDLGRLIEFARAEQVTIRMENFIDFPTDLSARALPGPERTRYASELAELAADCRSRGEEQTAQQLRGVIAYMSAA